MKLTISRKVIFRKSEKAESIINQYSLDGSIEDVQHMLLCLIDVLNHDFTQEKKKGKK